MPGENYFFDDIFSRRNELGDPSNPDDLKRIHERLMTMYGRYNMMPDQERVDSLASGPLSVESFSGCRSYRDVLTRFMEVQVSLMNKERWGNHTPRDLYNIDDIISFYPEAKIVACVRDPRDFMLSYRDKWKIREGREALRLKSLYHPVITAMQWKSSIKQVLSLEGRVAPENLFVMKYEDLVQDAEKTVPNLCDFLGEAYYSGMLEVSGSNSSTGQGSAKGIFSSSAGRWKRQLESADADIMQIVAGKEMEKLGYHVESLNCSLWFVVWKFITAPFAVARGLYMNRHKRGPLIPYIVRRLKPFFRL